MSGTVAVLAVSDDAGVADRVGRVLGNAGFKVVGPRDIDASQVVEAVKAANASAVVVVGDGDLPGLSAARLAATFTRSIPGWAPVVYAAAFQALGPRAVQHRTVAGFVDGCPIVALPAEAAFAMVAVEQVLVAELGRWIQAGMELVMAGDEAIEPSPSVPDALVLVGDTDTDSDDDPPALSPSGRLGALGRRGNSFSITATPDEAAPPPEEEAEDGPPAGGWKRAVWDLGGEIRFDEREELPQPVEKLAPLHDVLHTAGETAVLVLPNKLRYSIWGWPDLRRANSKVVAVGWGEPLCEVLALHRTPVLTGTCIEEARGQLPARASDVARLCTEVTGRAPPDTSGEVFALDGSTVWIQRGRRVFTWDGSRERDDGNPKQVLSSLVLRWSNR